jgi:hypothetical protein
VVSTELEERVSGQFQDIGQVPAINFDWLPFTPLLWSPSPVLHKIKARLSDGETDQSLYDLSIAVENGS